MSRPDRAVSEVVSFLLLFAVLLGVGLAGAVYGVESLGAATDAEAVHAGERAMGTFRADLADLAVGASHRSTSMAGPPVTLRFAEPSRLHIEVVTSEGVVDLADIRPTAVSYDAGPASVTYETGALLWSDGKSGRLLSGPTWRIDREQTVVTLFNTSQSGGPTTFRGETARIQSTVRKSEVSALDATRFPDVDTLTVRVTLTTPHASAWGRHLDRDDRFEHLSVDTGSATVVAAFTTESIVVKTLHVDVRFVA